MERIVVTGSTSMIGVATIEVVLSHGVEVFAIVRKSTPRIGRLPKSHLRHIVYGDLDGMLNLEGIPADCDVLYYFAWAGTSRELRDDPKIQERNIAYTLR